MLNTGSTYKALVKTIAGSTIGLKENAAKAKQVIAETWLAGNSPLSKELQFFRTAERIRPIKSESEAWNISDKLLEILASVNKQELEKAKTNLSGKLGGWVYQQPVSDIDAQLQLIVNEAVSASHLYKKTMAKKKLVKWLMEETKSSLSEDQPSSFTKEELLAFPVFAANIDKKYSELLPEQKKILQSLATGNLTSQLNETRKRFERLVELVKSSLDSDANESLDLVKGHPAYAGNASTDDVVLLHLGIADLNRQLEVSGGKTGLMKETIEANEPLVKRYLLTEAAPFEYDQKSVVEDDAGCITVAGILQRADSLNQNGRIYPLNILKREIENYKSLIKRRGSFGELDHRDDQTVQMKYVSHMITEINMDDEGVVRGKVKIFDTNEGKNLKAIIKGGGVPGISSRAVGNFKVVNNVKMIQDDLMLICWDFVHEPSTPGAFMHISEAKEILMTESSIRMVFSNSISAQVERAVNNIMFTLKG